MKVPIEYANDPTASICAEFFALVDTNHDESIQKDELLEIIKIYNPDKDAEFINN